MREVKERILVDTHEEALREELQRTIVQTVGRLMHLWMQTSRRFFRGRGLSFGQAMILRHLYYRQPCTISDMAADMGISSPAVSQMLDRLVEMGLVTREENPLNRRQKQVALTAAGRTLLKEAEQVQKQWLQNVLNTLSREEAEHLQRAFSRLNERLEAFRNLQRDVEE